MENVEVELKRIMRAERNFDIYIYICNREREEHFHSVLY